MRAGKLSPTEKRMGKALRKAAGSAPIERTRPALAKVVHCAPIYAGNVLASMHMRGKIHIESWTHHTNVGPFTPAWAWGKGEDAPKPGRKAVKVIDWRTRPAGKKIAAWLQAGNRGTMKQIAEACCMAMVTASQMVTLMRRDKLVRITKYVQETAPVAVYGWLTQTGPRKDAPKPPRLSVTQWRHRRRDQLAEKYGPEMAKKICTAMFTKHEAVTIVIDGKAVYKRGVGVLEDLRTAS